MYSQGCVTLNRNHNNISPFCLPVCTERYEQVLNAHNVGGEMILCCMLCDMRSFDQRPVSFTVAEFVYSLILFLSRFFRRHCGFTIFRATNALAVCKQFQLVFESHAHHTPSSFRVRELKRNFISWIGKKTVCDTIFWSLITVFTVTTCCSMELYVLLFPYENATNVIWTPFMFFFH